MAGCCSFKLILKAFLAFERCEEIDSAVENRTWIHRAKCGRWQEEEGAGGGEVAHIAVGHFLHRL